MLGLSPALIAMISVLLVLAPPPPAALLLAPLDGLELGAAQAASSVAAASSKSAPR